MQQDDLIPATAPQSESGDCETFGPEHDPQAYILKELACGAEAETWEEKRWSERNSNSQRRV